MTKPNKIKVNTLSGKANQYILDLLLLLVPKHTCTSIKYDQDFYHEYIFVSNFYLYYLSNIIKYTVSNKKLAHFHFCYYISAFYPP